MITCSVDDGGHFRRRLQKLADDFPEGAKRALYRIGSTVRDTSAKYAPKSPTRAEALRGSAKRQRAGGRNSRQIAGGVRGGLKMRKDRSTSRPMPGELQRSIKFKRANRYVDIYVPSNSMAGKYAVKMHDERGKTWKHLGYGSKAKGPQAREKFILRAVKHHDQNGDIMNILSSELAKVGL